MPKLCQMCPMKKHRIYCEYYVIRTNHHFTFDYIWNSLKSLQLHFFPYAHETSLESLKAPSKPFIPWLFGLPRHYSEAAMQEPGKDGVALISTAEARHGNYCFQCQLVKKKTIHTYHESNMNPTWWIMMSDENLLGFEIQMDLRFSVLIRLPTASRPAWCRRFHRRGDSPCWFFPKFLKSLK